jgi:hypothetical protein
MVSSAARRCSEVPPMRRISASDSGASCRSPDLIDADADRDSPRQEQGNAVTSPRIRDASGRAAMKSLRDDAPPAVARRPEARTSVRRQRQTQPVVLGEVQTGG